MIRIEEFGNGRGLRVVPGAVARAQRHHTVQPGKALGADVLVLVRIDRIVKGLLEVDEDDSGLTQRDQQLVEIILDEHVGMQQQHLRDGASDLAAGDRIGVVHGVDHMRDECLAHHPSSARASSQSKVSTVTCEVANPSDSSPLRARARDSAVLP